MEEPRIYRVPPAPRTELAARGAGENRILARVHGDRAVVSAVSMAFHCADCGKDHEGLPDLGMHAPDPYLAVPENERPNRTFFTEDRCTVRDEDGVEHYFVRGVLFIPIHGQDDPFGIGLWVSQSRANYERFLRNEVVGPTFGWLVNRIKHYKEDTFLLKTAVHFSGDNRRPTIELEPCDHPLAIEQRTGISLARAWQIVHRYLPN